MLLLLAITLAAAASTPEALFDEAMKALAAKEYATALGRLEAAVAAEPENMRYASEYRQAAIVAREFDRSIKFFEKVAASHPRSANVRLNYGYAFIDKLPLAGLLGRPSLAGNALEQFTKAVELQPGLLTYYTRGYSYLFWPRIFNRARLGVADLEAAMKVQKTEPKRSYHARGYIALGDAYWKTDNLPKAKPMWQEGLREFPENAALKMRAALTGDALKDVIGDAYDFKKRIDTNLRELWDTSVTAPAAAARTVAAAADLTLRDMRGSPQSLSQFRGKVVVLNFWATWCEPCRHEMPLFVEAQKRFGPSIVVVAASLDDAETQKIVAEFARKQKINFPVWLGATVPTLEKLGLGHSLPATAFINPEGEIAGRVLGQIRSRDLFPRLEWMLGKRTGAPPPPVVNNLGGADAPKAALAVVEKIAGEVGFYSADGKRIGGVKVGTHPHEIILSPDKRHLYVTDNGILWMTNPGEGGNTISIIDVAARKKAGTIDLGAYRRPHGIAVDPKTGRIAVTIENPDGLLLIDPVKRQVLRKFDVQGADPHMVLFGPGGEYAYVSNTASASVAAVHVATGKVKLIPTGARPQGGVLSRDGRLLYVTNSDANSISIIDTSKNEVVETIATGKGPARIGLTPDGATLVYNLGEGGNAVAFADVRNRKQVAVIPIGGRPLSLTLSADGRTAFAGIQDQDKIAVISVPDRKIMRLINTPKGAGPDPVLPLP